MPDRRHPAIELHRRGNHDHQAGRGKETRAHLRQPSGKHVVNPDTESQEAGGHYRRHDWHVSEDVTAREHSYYRRDDCRRR